jgi:signal transduction histidine kinase
MTEIKSRIIFFAIVFIFQIKLFAKVNDRLGETEIYSVSPLSMIQIRNDSILKSRYQNAKSLFNKKEYAKSLESSLAILDEAVKNGNNEIELLCSFLIAEVFSNLNNREKAISYFKKSLLLLKGNELIKDTKLYPIDSTYNFLRLKGKTFLSLGTEFAKLNSIDSAKYFYEKVIEINSLNNDIQTIKAAAYNNLSGVYIRKSSFGLAKTYALKSVEIRRKLNDKLNEAAALGNLASVHVIEKDFEKAKIVYKKALDLIEKDKSSRAIKYKEDLNYNLAWALYNLKDFTAYDYQEKSYLIKDSLRNAEFEHIVQQVYEKYQADIAKKQADKAESDVKLKELEERKTTIFFTILFILLLGISGFVLYTYKLRQRNLKLKLEQTEFAQKSKLDKLKSESQVRILNATLDGKETERKQIAETLHDSVSSLLSSANLHLQATKMQFNGDTPIEIDKTQKIIIEASQTIRDLSHTLVSSVLLKFGLKYAIKDMAEKYSNSQLKIDTNIKNVRRYHQGFEIKVNNIVQEFVNNILKHSNATKALVRVEDMEGVLHINIQDDGEGFDKRDIPKKDGLGINQIDARIQMMKGKFLINSSAETGTIIEIELPIKEKETTVSA